MNPSLSNPLPSRSRQSCFKTGFLFLAAALISTANAQFVSGSDGSYGPIDVPSGQTVTLQLPPNGIFHATTITVGENAVLNFLRNVANTPVYLLATGDVSIASNGKIDVSGKEGQGGATPLGGAGGPGGFDGGAGQVFGQLPGDGQGPGGGKGGESLSVSQGSSNQTDVGNGGFGQKFSSFNNARLTDGPAYGSALLVPLVGGSGGGGTVSGDSGGGGGGAILLASSTKISWADSSSRIVSTGGYYNLGTSAGCGSGGAVRLVAPRLEGDGVIDVGGYGYSGRIRIDSIFRDDLRLRLQPTGVGSIGGNMVVFPGNLPKLEIVEAAGQVIDPANNQPVTVQIPSGAPAEQLVKIRASNFGDTAKVKVVLTPEFGSKISYDLDIPNPGPSAATGSAAVEFPVNQLTRVDVWTR